MGGDDLHTVGDDIPEQFPEFLSYDTKRKFCCQRCTAPVSIEEQKSYITFCSACDTITVASLAPQPPSPHLPPDVLRLIELRQRFNKILLGWYMDKQKKTGAANYNQLLHSLACAVLDADFEKTLAMEQTDGKA